MRPAREPHYLLVFSAVAGVADDCMSYIVAGGKQCAGICAAARTSTMAGRGVFPSGVSRLNEPSRPPSSL